MTEPSLAVIITRLDSMKETINELKQSVKRLEDRRDGYMRAEQCHDIQKACEARMKENIKLCAKAADVEPMKKIVWGLVLTALGLLAKEIITGRNLP